MCIVCDSVILGTEAVNHLKPHHLKVHRERPGVEEYKKLYGEDGLHQELERQYAVDGFPSMILSRRSRNDPSGCPCCTCCFCATRPSIAEANQPKFSLDHGYVTGLIQRGISFKTKDGEVISIEITEEDLTDLLRLFLAPVRPYGCILGHTGGKHKSIMGHYQFFETYLSHLCAALNLAEVKQRFGHRVDTMICGRMTPRKKQRVAQRSVIDFIGTRQFLAGL